MPGFDGTGPLGRGALTGRGRWMAGNTSQAQEMQPPGTCSDLAGTAVGQGDGTAPASPGHVIADPNGPGRRGIPRGCGRGYGGRVRRRCNR